MFDSIDTHIKLLLCLSDVQAAPPLFSYSSAQNPIIQY